MTPYKNPVVETVLGKLTTFPKITMSDYAELFQVIRTIKKNKITQAFENKLITNEQKNEAILALINSEDHILEVQNSVGDPVMVQKILECSWKKTKYTPEELKEIIENEDPVFLATIARLCTMRTEKKEEIDPLAPKKKQEVEP